MKIHKNIDNEQNNTNSTQNFSLLLSSNYVSYINHILVYQRVKLKSSCYEKIITKSETNFCIHLITLKLYYTYGNPTPKRASRRMEVQASTP